MSSWEAFPNRDEIIFHNVQRSLLAFSEKKTNECKPFQNVNKPMQCFHFMMMTEKYGSLKEGGDGKFRGFQLTNQNPCTVNLRLRGRITNILRVMIIKSIRKNHIAETSY